VRTGVVAADLHECGQMLASLASACMECADQIFSGPRNNSLSESSDGAWTPLRASPQLLDQSIR
jgi:hypothetical protein